MSELYYLQDKRDYVGNSMLWWRAGGSGYCCDVREAGVFTKEQAFAQHRCRETDIPWPRSYIDARVAHHVDMQRVKLTEARATELETSAALTPAEEESLRERADLMHRPAEY